MFIPKEILHNALMGLPPIKRWAVRRHRSTGMNRDPAKVDEVYRFYRRVVDPRGRRILEIGIGQTPDVLLRARADGAASVAALDVNRYFAPVSADEQAIDYRIYDGGTFPFASAAFDVIWSSNVIQQFRRPERTVAEIARVLAPAGHLLLRVDLRDCLHLQDRARWRDCHRYPAWLWKAMTWYRGTYVNRLLLSDWQRLFAAAGLDEIEIQRERHADLVASGRQYARLREASDDDLATLRFDGVWRRRGGADAIRN